jgi:4-diphosphocytidyl-2-C-methyl-D-erythritol kinase
MASTRISAPSKVNLFLEITGKRPDGYHTLSTIFQTISLADELTFSDSDTLHLSCSDTSLPTDERNLVYKAAALLQDKNHGRGVRMHLKKNVPMGAGLGGGSSDAATVLKHLVKRWKMKLSPRALHALARHLGADVAFFLKGGTCSAGGIGDLLKPVSKLPKTWLVLVYPGFGVSTKEAYANVRVPVSHPRSAHSMLKLLHKPHPQAWAGELFNRFEEFVFPKHPQLPRLKKELLDAGALGALMSGSGSTMFGVMSGPAEGRRALKHLRKKYPQSWLVHSI